MNVVNNIVFSGNGLAFGTGVHQLQEVVAGISNGMPQVSSSNEELERSSRSSETVGSYVQEFYKKTTISVESKDDVSSEVREFLQEFLLTKDNPKD